MKAIDQVLCVTPAVLVLGALAIALRDRQPAALAVGIVALIAGFAVVPLTIQRTII